MGGVGDQPPLTGLGPLQPFQHAVHGPGEAADLVVGRRVGNPPVQGGGGDGVDLGPDRLHRGQRPADHHPGRHRHHRQQQWQPDGQQPGDGRGRLLHGLGGAGDHHRARPQRGVGGGGHGQELGLLLERPAGRDLDLGRPAGREPGHRGRPWASVLAWTTRPSGSSTWMIHSSGSSTASDPGRWRPRPAPRPRPGPAAGPRPPPPGERVPQHRHQHQGADRHGQPGHHHGTEGRPDPHRPQPPPEPAEARSPRGGGGSP